MSLILVDLLYDWQGLLADALCLACEGLHGVLEGLLLKLSGLSRLELALCERAFYGKNLQELLADSDIVIVVDDGGDTVPNEIGDIHADALSHKGVAAFLVDDCALLVHDIVILKETLTYAEVVLLYFLLRTLDGHQCHRACAEES